MVLQLERAGIGQEAHRARIGGAEGEGLARANGGRIGDGEAVRPGTPDGSVIRLRPQRIGAGADLIRKLRELRRRDDVVLVRRQRAAVEQEMSAAAAAVPEIILRGGAAERVAVAEQRRRGEGLIGEGLDAGIRWRHHRARYRSARSR